MTTLNKKIIRIVIGTGVILLIPLVMTLLGSGVDGDGWHWTPSDFVFMGALLFGTGLTYELVARKAKTGAYRAAVGVAVVTALLLVWMNAAVGIIGDGDLDNPTNLMYFGVLVVGAIGAAIGRLEPRGMARALLATALAQALVPVLALAVWNPQVHSWGGPGVLGVFVLNTFFVLLFLGSALLFRRASTTTTQ